VQGIDERVVIELFAEGGQEFTALVLDVGSGNESRSVTLIPTEVVILVLISFFFVTVRLSRYCILYRYIMVLTMLNLHAGGNFWRRFE